MVCRHLFFILSASGALACGKVVAVEPGSEAGAIAEAAAEAQVGAEAEADDTGTADSASTDGEGPTDAATFACGSTFCRGTEVCVHPACGCVLPIVPMTDSGACPDGSAFADALDRCIPTTIGCLPPYCWSPNPSESSLYCSGQDGGLSGMIYTVPEGFGLVCYGECV